jgi:drug/metabolite transporter (DMT)-like permease
LNSWAYSLTFVAYVKAVGQVESVAAVLYSLLIWKESEVSRQVPGMALTLVGIVLVLLGGSPA